MKVSFTKRFSAQLDNLRDPTLLNKVSKIVQGVMQAHDLHDIANLKKIKGHHSAYRIRIGNYRIGIFIESDTIIFAVLGHRKDIYRAFP